MKNKTIKTLAAALALVGASLSSPAVFADNPYGINYGGGQALGTNNNVQIEPTLVDSLLPLIGDTPQISTSNSSRWKSGYIMSNNRCTKGSYFKVWGDGNMIYQNTAGDDLSFTITGDKYKAVAQVNQVYFDGNTVNVTANNAFSVMVADNGYFYVGFGVYSDAQCTEPIRDVEPLQRTDGIDVYLSVNLKMYEKATGKAFVSDGMYFNINDIDSGQSYKILSSGSELTPANMFAKSAAALQSNDPSVTLKNMYVPSGKYIYSQYDDVNDDILNLDKESQIFVKVDQATQKNGLNVVFGFTYQAGSGLQYYAKQYQVVYTSDNHGIITGITNEKVVSGDSPRGSTSGAKQGYEFVYWIADKDVTLTNGTVVKAGEKMTADQVKSVVVTQDLKFTAIHGTTAPATPDTGGFTEDGNNSVAVLGVILPVGAVLALVGYLAYDRKKHSVGFNK